METDNIVEVDSWITPPEPGLQSPEPLGEPSMVRFGRIAGTVLFWVFLSLGITFAINLAVYLCK